MQCIPYIIYTLLRGIWMPKNMQWQFSITNTYKHTSSASYTEMILRLANSFKCFYNWNTHTHTQSMISSLTLNSKCQICTFLRAFAVPALPFQHTYFHTETHTVTHTSTRTSYTWRYLYMAMVMWLAWQWTFKTSLWRRILHIKCGNEIKMLLIGEFWIPYPFLLINICPMYI